jgi:PAS domain S-box-containing protein
MKHDKEAVRELHSSLLPMWIFDQESLKFLDVNDAALDRYGYTRDEFLRLTLVDIRPVQDIPRVLHATLWHPQATTEPTMWRHQAKNGEIFPVVITSRNTMFNGKKAEIVRTEPLGPPATFEPSLCSSNFLDSIRGH